MAGLGLTCGVPSLSTAAMHCDALCHLLPWKWPQLHYSRVLGPRSATCFPRFDHNSYGNALPRVSGGGGSQQWLHRISIIRSCYHYHSSCAIYKVVSLLYSIAQELLPFLGCVLIVHAMIKVHVCACGLLGLWLWVVSVSTMQLVLGCCGFE